MEADKNHASGSALQRMRILITVKQVASIADTVPVKNKFWTWLDRGLFACLMTVAQNNIDWDTRTHTYRELYLDKEELLV